MRPPRGPCLAAAERRIGDTMAFPAKSLHGGAKRQAVVTLATSPPLAEITVMGSGSPQVSEAPVGVAPARRGIVGAPGATGVIGEFRPPARRLEVRRIDAP